MIAEDDVAALVADFDSQLDQLLATIRADLLASGFPPRALPRVTAKIVAKLAAHREVTLAQLQRSAGAQLH